MSEFKILIGIDCLFDTFFANVINTNTEWAEPLIQKGYLKRISNNLHYLLPTVDKDLIKDNWNKRTADLLRSGFAVRTTFINQLIEYLKEHTTGNEERPDNVNFKVIINTYPYDFTNRELKELFITLKELLQFNQITRIHKHTKELTPQYLKESINKFIIYDFEEWLEYNGSLLKQLPIKNITCVTPLNAIHAPKSETNIKEGLAKTPIAFIQHLDLELVTLADMSFDPVYIKSTFKE